MDTDSLRPLTEQILGAVFEVSNTLGGGFLEKVYERALLRELRLRGLQAIAQPEFSVFYKGDCVGEYCADMLVENEVVVELKCAERLTNQHAAQCLNYLRTCGKSLCLLVNFQKPEVEWRRLVLTPNSGNTSGKAYPAASGQSLRPE